MSTGGTAGGEQPINCYNAFAVRTALSQSLNYAASRPDGAAAAQACNFSLRRMGEAPGEVLAGGLGQSLFDDCNQEMRSLEDTLTSSYRAFPMTPTGYQELLQIGNSPHKTGRGAEQCNFTMYRTVFDRLPAPIAQGSISRSGDGTLALEGKWLSSRRDQPFKTLLTINNSGHVFGEMRMVFGVSEEQSIFKKNVRVFGNGPRSSQELKQTGLTSKIDAKTDALLRVWACSVDPAAIEVPTFLAGSWSTDCERQQEVYTFQDVELFTQSFYRSIEIGPAEPTQYSVLTEDIVHDATGLTLRKGDVIVLKTAVSAIRMVDSNTLVDIVAYLNPDSDFIRQDTTGQLRADGLLVADGSGMQNYGRSSKLSVQRCN